MAKPVINRHAPGKLIYCVRLAKSVCFFSEGLMLVRFKDGTRRLLNGLIFSKNIQ